MAKAFRGALMVPVLLAATIMPFSLGAPAWAQAPSVASSGKDAKGEADKAPLTAADRATIAAGVALIQSQPVAFTMVRGPVPWVKTCPNASAADDCQAIAAFAFDPIAANTLEISVDTLASNKNHAITVVLPLDLQLQAGFTFGWGGDHAARGTYATCRKIGCIGSVVLASKDYDAFRKASKVAIAFTTLGNRNVELQAPLEGMNAAIDGKAVDKDELQALSEAAVKRHNEMVGEYNERVAKAKAAAPAAGDDHTAANKSDGDAKAPGSSPADTTPTALAKTR